MKSSRLIAAALVLASVTPLIQAQDRFTTRSVTRPFTDQALVTTAPSIPLWTGTSGAYKYRMVGQSPVTALATPTTTINVPIIPLAFVFADGTTFDPSVANATCSPQGSALALVQASPLFSGATQYADAYQRANFWQYTGAASAPNPNYHLLLTASPRAAVKIQVPASVGSVTGTGCAKFGQVEINWLDSYLQHTVYPAAGILPTELAVFLTYNSVLYETGFPKSLILGYHSAFAGSATGNAAQTYAVANFDTTGTLGKDVAPLSHEIGEWVADPLGDNPTPAWGNVGQVSGCTSGLEVGDPLTGTETPVTASGGYVYHLQELAFASWFYHDTPSLGINGWYSSNGTFTTAAKPCAGSYTTLSLSSTAVPNGGQVTATIHVTSATSGLTTTPSGNVTLVSSTGATLATFTLAAGSASGVVTLPSGNYSVTAKYAGDSTFTASSSQSITINPGAPALQLSATSLAFGSVAVGSTSATQTITITNTGIATQVGISVSRSGANSSDFPTSYRCSSIAAGATCAVQVSFRPLADGARSATLSIGGLFASARQTVTLTGMGSGGPELKLSAASLTFGSSNVGTATAAQTITVSNSGSGSLTGLSSYLAGANTRDFTRTTTCGSTLAATASCTISVIFQPTLAGARTATVQISGNGLATLPTISLSGTGTGGPQLQASVTSLAFGSSAVGIATAAQAVTISNPGTSTLTGFSASLTGVNSHDFTRTTTCGSSLVAGATCTIAVTFQPILAGARTATLQLSGQGVPAPAAISLAGTGTGGPQLKVSAASLAFGISAVGTTTAAQALTISNTGTSAMTGLSFSVSGGNSRDFNRTSTCGNSLAAAATCTVNVTFKPAGIGARASTLTVSATATGSPVAVALTGTGK